LRKSGGFTFMEVLIVLFMIGIISAIAAPSFLKWRSGAKLRGVAENLKGNLELAKLKALQVNGAVTVEFTENGYRIFVDIDEDGSPDPPTTDSILKEVTILPGIKIDTADTSFGGDLTARFFGRGTADAGHALLVNSSGKTKRVVVSPIGRIRIEDG